VSFERGYRPDKQATRRIDPSLQSKIQNQQSSFINSSQWARRFECRLMIVDFGLLIFKEDGTAADGKSTDWIRNP
jgi:hypothetical protein